MDENVININTDNLYWIYIICRCNEVYVIVKKIYNNPVALGETLPEDMVSIAIWPDDNWCFVEELEEYIWKSDDYIIKKVSLNLEEDGIDKYVHIATFSCGFRPYMIYSTMVVGLKSIEGPMPGRHAWSSIIL